ncbi:MAG: 50S ribosomal protein L15 [Pseudomonadales bacterium]|jgi:large subunit ribosomal protein L15|nr:50S ribosomal protein L15 [Pseudomonadales bacterium]
MSHLGNLKPTVSRGAKRLGRGYGSGKGGHTSGRGMKGMGARKSGNVPLWFEGGQLPLTKRMPMLRGKAKFNVVRPTAQLSLTDLEKMSISEISIASLKENKIIDKRFHKVKIVATGTLSRKVTIVDVRTTKAAKEAIEKAGGTV